MDLLGIYHHSIPEFLARAAQTPPLRRLRGVGMNCGCEYTSFPQFAGWQPYSRYDHSLGAALIVWHFTADPCQAMAALLHDAATPVFSHVVDFFRGDYMTQESTEAGLADIVTGSGELMQVLAEFAIPVESVLDYHRYPIADNDSPKLSADRLEYTLGNIVNFSFGDEQRVRWYYEDLMAAPGELVFRHEDRAAAFARDALRCGRVYVSDEDRFSMQLLAELLKKAVQAGILTEQDLYLQERDVIERLMASPVKQDWLAFRQLRRVLRTQGEGRRIPAKKRWIDPALTDGRRVSQWDEAFAQHLEAFLREDLEIPLIAAP